MVRWYGFGYDYLMPDAPGGPSNYLNNWKQAIDYAKKWNFNTVRLAFCFASAPRTNTSLSILDYAKLDQLLTLLDSNNLKAILDLHNYGDMYGYFGSNQWINSWVDFVENFNNDQRIIAWEMFNEPYEATWDRSTIISLTDVPVRCAACIDAIRATGDRHTIVYPYIHTVGLHVPPELMRQNLVMTCHTWDVECARSTIQEAITCAQNYFKYGQPTRPTRESILNYRAEGFDLWMGECGLHETGTTLEVEQAHLLELVNIALANNLGFNLWRYCDPTMNPNYKVWTDEVLQASNFTPKLINTLPLIFLLGITLLMGGAK